MCKSCENDMMYNDNLSISVQLQKLRDKSYYYSKLNTDLTIFFKNYNHNFKNPTFYTDNTVLFLK